MWHRHRSAPASAWFAASLGLIAGLVVFGSLDALVVRPARELSPFTRGITRATLASPSPERAVYRVTLRPREGSESPSGARVVAHRWTIQRSALRPSDGAPSPVVGEDTTCVAEGDGARVELALPLRANEWGEGRRTAVPSRLRAVVVEASEAGATYTEWRVLDGQRADVVGCVRTIDGRRALGDCGDGGPSRVFLLPSRAVARARSIVALERVSAVSGAFAIACVLAGFTALSTWRRRAP
jgi:hypothetical protein